jgi:hypothetical protein
MAERRVVLCEDCGQTILAHLEKAVREKCGSSGGYGRFRRPPALRRADR